MTLAGVNENSTNFRSLILRRAVNSDVKKIAELKPSTITLVSDTLESQVAELIKINNSTQVFSMEALKEQVSAFFKTNDKETFGLWVYYPWRNTLVRTLNETDFIRLRTSRNRYKITQEEQDSLNTK